VLFARAGSYRCADDGRRRRRTGCGLGAEIAPLSFLKETRLAPYTFACVEAIKRSSNMCRVMLECGGNLRAGRSWCALQIRHHGVHEGAGHDATARLWPLCQCSPKSQT